MVQSSKPPLSSSEKWGILVLLTLYFIQGIPLGFLEALNLLLMEKGVSYSELSILSLAIYPFSFKLFIAPIEDAIFSKRIGKRKTYILPLQYILGVLFILLSYQIDSLLASRSIVIFTAICFLLVLCAAMQDIAVDGWVLTILSEENSGWGSVCQSIGQTLGVLVSGTISIQLNSLKFCNEVIYSSPQTEPVLPIRTFCLLSGFAIIIINLCVQFLKQEKHTEGEEIQSVLKVLSTMKGFYYNRNLRRFIIYDILCIAPFAVIKAVRLKILMENGLDKETLSTMAGILLPFSFLVSFLVQYFTHSGHELKQCLRAYILFFIHNILLYLLFLFIGSLGSRTLVIIVFVLEFYGTIPNYMEFVAGGAFRNKISDPSIGGSSLTFLNSMFNFGNSFMNSLSLFLIEYVSYHYLTVFGWIFGFFFFFLFSREFSRLDSLTKEEFALSYLGEDEKKRE